MALSVKPPDGVREWLASFERDAKTCAASREWTRLAHGLTMLGVPQPGEDDDVSNDVDLAWVDAHPGEYAALVAALIPREALKPLAAVFARDVKASRICTRPEYAAFIRDWLRSL
jgi:hypothetical protein